MLINWYFINLLAVSIVVLGVPFLIVGAIVFFVLDKQAAMADQKREFEALEGLRWGQPFQYIALKLRRQEAWALNGTVKGPVKTVYFVQLADGTVHTAGSRILLKPVKITYRGQQWSTLTFQTKRARRQYQVQLDQATYQLLLVNWFKPLQAVA